MTLTDRICGTDSMIDISLIPVFGTSQVDSFYNLHVYKLSSSSCASYYHICDTPQSLPDISSGVLRSVPKSFIQSPKDAHDRHFKREFIDRAALLLAEFDDCFIALLQNFSFHEPKRSLNFTVATRWQRQKSHSFTLRSCRSAGQEKQQYAPSTENLRAYQNCKTLTDKGLRSFLLTLLVSAWCVPAHRFNLKKSAQTEREERRSTGCKNCTFLRWIDPHPDSAIVVQSAIFLQEGGAL